MKKIDLSNIETSGLMGGFFMTKENDEEKRGAIKYNYIVEQLTKINFIDEEHGVLTIEDITRKCAKVLEQYDVNFCYLFGSYAKGTATDTSDVDLLISTAISGIQFYDLVETVRETLQKKVDVLNHKQLNDNPELVHEILKDGIKIYG